MASVRTGFIIVDSARARSSALSPILPVRSISLSWSSFSLLRTSVAIGMAPSPICASCAIPPMPAFTPSSRTLASVARLRSPGVSGPDCAIEPTDAMSIA